MCLCLVLGFFWQFLKNRVFLLLLLGFYDGCKESFVAWVDRGGEP